MSGELPMEICCYIHWFLHTSSSTLTTDCDGNIPFLSWFELHYCSQESSHLSFDWFWHQHFQFLGFFLHSQFDRFISPMLPLMMDNFRCMKEEQNNLDGNWRLSWNYQWHKTLSQTDFNKADSKVILQLWSNLNERWLHISSHQITDWRLVFRLRTAVIL